MIAKRKIIKRNHKPAPQSSNKNLVGFGGVLMIILTNYQVQIKEVITAITALTGLIK